MCNTLFLWIKTCTVGAEEMEPQEIGAFQISSSTNTPAEKAGRRNLFTSLLFSSSASACGSVCLPVCRGRCSISLTRFMVLWFSLISKLPLVSKSLQGLRVEIGPLARGENERTRPETQVYFTTVSSCQLCSS